MVLLVLLVLVVMVVVVTVMVMVLPRLRLPRRMRLRPVRRRLHLQWRRLRAEYLWFVVYVVLCGSINQGYQWSVGGGSMDA